MRLLFILFLITAFTATAIPQGLQTQDTGLTLFNKYPAGLNTEQATHLISDVEFSDLENVVFDDDYTVRLRPGTLKKNTDTPTGTGRLLHEYVKSGSRYLVRITSNVLSYSQNQSQYTTLLSTIPTNTTYAATNYNGYCFITTYDGDCWKLDGGTVYQSTVIPQARYIMTYKDKIVVAYVNETNGNSIIKYSRVGYPESWTNGYYIYINKDDGDEITGIFEYSGNLYCTKRYSINLVTGLDDDYNTNDGFTKIVNGVGCSYGQTAKQKDNYMVFMSKRGIEAFDGSNVTPIAQNIESSIVNATQNEDINGLNFIDDTSDEFLAYTSSYNFKVQDNKLYATVTNYYIPDTGGNVGRCTSIYHHGNKTYVSYYDVQNVELKISTFVIDAYSTGTYTSYNDTATLENAGGIIAGANAACITYASGAPLVYYNYTAAGKNIVKCASTTNATALHDEGGMATGTDIDAVNDSADMRTVIYSYSLGGYQYVIVGTHTASTFYYNQITNVGGGAIGITKDTGNKPYFAYSDAGTGLIYYSSITSNMYFSTKNTGVLCGDQNYGKQLAIDLDENNKIYIAARNATGGASIWTSTSGVTWTTSTVVDGNLLYIDMDIYNSTNIAIIYVQAENGVYNTKAGVYNGVTWSTTTLIVTTQTATIYSGISVKYSDEAIPYCSFYDPDTNKLKVLIPKAVYISNVKQAVSDNYAWENWQSFISSYTGTGQPIYYTRNNTSNTNIQTTQFAETTNGGTVPNGNGSIIQYKIVCKTPDYSTTSIDSVELDFNAGYKNTPPRAIVSDRRYILSFSTETGLTNNTAYVLDKNNKWTKWTGLKVGDYCIFRNKTLYTDMIDGNIYELSDDYTDDNGTAIDNKLTLKDFDLGTGTREKVFRDLWITTKPTALYSSTTVKVYVNKSTSAIATQYQNNTATENAYKPITITYQPDIGRFKYIRIEFNNFLELYGLRLRYKYLNETPY